MSVARVQSLLLTRKTGPRRALCRSGNSYSAGGWGRSER